MRTNTHKTENDGFRQADTCASVVDKTVETVNNILYMQPKQRDVENRLTKNHCPSIIMWKTEERRGIYAAYCV